MVYEYSIVVTIQRKRIVIASCLYAFWKKYLLFTIILWIKLCVKNGVILKTQNSISLEINLQGAVLSAIYNDTESQLPKNDNMSVSFDHVTGIFIFRFLSRYLFF